VSEVSVAEFKSFARIIHSDDDALIAILLETAEDECARFLNRSQLATLPLEYPSESETEEVPSSSDPIAPSVRMAVYWLTLARYEGKDADEVMKVRQAVETILYPYRTELGV
jgi:hypothetical protein